MGKPKVYWVMEGVYDAQRYWVKKVNPQNMETMETLVLTRLEIEWTKHIHGDDLKLLTYDQYLNLLSEHNNV